VAASLDEINAYPQTRRLSPPRTVQILESRPDRPRLKELGRAAALAGQIFWEHAAAGEGARLGLGPKFLIKPSDLSPQCGQSDQSDLADLGLGLRRLGRFFFEVDQLARAAGLEPLTVLGRQKLLVVASEDAIDEVAQQTLAVFGSVAPAANWLFMAQAAFPGLKREAGQDWEFDLASPHRLHNHGSMAWQKTMDGQLFRRTVNDPTRHYLSQAEFFQLLTEFVDLVSLNVEDLDYLTQALDLETLGLAIELGKKDYGMVMEITANHPERPIKGGMCAYDEVLGRDVVIESFRLQGVQPRDITHLNKNFNHYPHPERVFSRLARQGLFLPAVVYDDRLYFQPVQGDLNFLVPTAFFTRRTAKAINSLKSAADIPSALLAMKKQDEDIGYREFMRALGL
jgi:hypothetical protein